MPYKVFLVEDEIVTREGIRDNVDWTSAGFQFCGEAPDGEMALPLIEAARPDLVITDIKMPFMDGLELGKILRERMPWIKIIILSGHDEFNYAQAALKIGVTEYLLKPVSAQDLHAALRKVAGLLEQEQQEQDHLRQLHSQAEDSQALQRERFLLRLVMGAESSAAAIEQGRQLGLELIARSYLVVLVKAGASGGAMPFDYQSCQQVERVVADVVAAQPNILLARKDLEELVLVLKGDRPEQLEQEAERLAERIRQSVEEQALCQITVTTGSPQKRLGDLVHSFASALAQAGEPEDPALASTRPSGLNLVKLDHHALENYLKSGLVPEFDSFFDAAIQPLCEAALQSALVRHYLFVDIVLTANAFVSSLGGDPEQVGPGVHQIEAMLNNMKTAVQIREQIERILSAALAFRDSQVGHEHARLTQVAKDFISAYYSDPNLSLNTVAAQVNLSPSHFSTVFSRETGQTFRDYLTQVRMERARELLRTTNLKIAEVALQCGYNDPHYFSTFFRKNTGQTPQDYRTAPQLHKKQGK